MVVKVLMGALFPWPEIGCSTPGRHGPYRVLPASPVTPTLEEEQEPVPVETLICPKGILGKSRWQWSVLGCIYKLPGEKSLTG